MGFRDPVQKDQEVSRGSGVQEAFLRTKNKVVGRMIKAWKWRPGAQGGVKVYKWVISFSDMRLQLLSAGGQGSEYRRQGRSEYKVPGGPRPRPRWRDPDGGSEGGPGEGSTVGPGGWKSVGVQIVGAQGPGCRFCRRACHPPIK